MINRQSLIDTGFIYAVLDKTDERHEACADVYRSLRDSILPEAVLPELAYLLTSRRKFSVLTGFLRYLAEGNLRVVSTEIQDLKRAAEILEKYADARVDFVDCVIVALAERLNIKRILTVDRRHFALFRPRHSSDGFEIVP